MVGKFGHMRHITIGILTLESRLRPFRGYQQLRGAFQRGAFQIDQPQGVDLTLFASGFFALNPSRGEGRFGPP